MPDRYYSKPLPHKKESTEVDRFLSRQLEQQGYAALSEGLASILGGATSCAEASAAHVAEDIGRMRECAIAARGHLLEAIEHLDASASYLTESRKALEGDTLAKAQEMTAIDMN